MRPLRRTLLFPAFASIAVASEPVQPTLALVGGRIIDGYEGRPIEDGVVLIAGERIVAVGRRSEVPVPPGTPTIDTRGMSVLPGLADMHVIAVRGDVLTHIDLLQSVDIVVKNGVRVR